MGAAPAIAIRECKPGDREAALRVLTEAFVDAPDVRVMVGSGPAAAGRLRRLSAMVFEPSAKLDVLVAELDSEVVGVLTWADLPECSAVGLRQLLTLVRVTGPRLFGAARMFSRASRVHPKSPHRHIPQLGVDPTVQGRGIGSALVEELCRRCDEDGLPAYLETYVWADRTRPSLRSFYERFGFSVTHEVRMHDTWTGIAMLRPSPPRPDPYGRRDG